MKTEDLVWSGLICENLVLSGSIGEDLVIWFNRWRSDLIWFDMWRSGLIWFDRWRSGSRIIVTSWKKSDENKDRTLGLPSLEGLHPCSRSHPNGSQFLCWSVTESHASWTIHTRKDHPEQKFKLLSSQKVLHSLIWWEPFSFLLCTKATPRHRGLSSSILLQPRTCSIECVLSTWIHWREHHHSACFYSVLFDQPCLDCMGR